MHQHLSMLLATDLVSFAARRRDRRQSDGSSPITSPAMVTAPMRSDAVADSTGEQRSVSQALRRVAIAGMFAGAVLYSNWLLEIVLRRTADPDLFISELAALDQPYGAWFRWGDRATAVVVGVAAAAAITGVRGNRWSTMGWSIVGVFALATGLDSTVWNMVCAPHSEPACAANEASGAVPLGDQLHLLSSATACVAAIFSMLAFSAADHIDQAPVRVLRFGWLVSATLIATAVWMGIAVSVDSADHSGLVGISQRSFLIATACWLICVGLHTARAPTHTTS